MDCATGVATAFAVVKERFERVVRDELASTLAEPVAVQPLFEITPLIARPSPGVSMLLTAVTFVACWIPPRSAAKVASIDASREQ